MVAAGLKKTLEKETVMSGGTETPGFPKFEGGTWVEFRYFSLN